MEHIDYAPVSYVDSVCVCALVCGVGGGGGLRFGRISSMCVEFRRLDRFFLRRSRSGGRSHILLGKCEILQLNSEAVSYWGVGYIASRVSMIFSH
jgi:hypothetical protein